MQKSADSNPFLLLHCIIVLLFSSPIILQLEWYYSLDRDTNPNWTTNTIAAATISRALCVIFMILVSLENVKKCAFGAVPLEIFSKNVDFSL